MRLAPFAILGLLAALVAGCGGGGGDKRLTHAELVSQGNAICVKASGDIDKLGDPASLADIARIGAQLATIREAETARLGALKVASDDEDGQTKLIGALTARDKTLRAGRRARPRRTTRPRRRRPSRRASRSATRPRTRRSTSGCCAAPRAADR